MPRGLQEIARAWSEAQPLLCSGNFVDAAACFTNSTHDPFKWIGEALQKGLQTAAEAAPAPAAAAAAEKVGSPPAAAAPFCRCARGYCHGLVAHVHVPPQMRTLTCMPLWRAFRSMRRYPHCYRQSCHAGFTAGAGCCGARAARRQLRSRSSPPQQQHELRPGRAGRGI